MECCIRLCSLRRALKAQLLRKSMRHVMADVSQCKLAQAIPKRIKSTFSGNLSFVFMRTPIASFLLGGILSLTTVYSVCAAQVHVATTKVGTNFTYIVFNDEPTNSNLHLGTFHLVVNAPFDVAGSPAGWSFETDNQTYVNWFSADSTAPYPNDI